MSNLIRSVNLSGNDKNKLSEQLFEEAPSASQDEKDSICKTLTGVEHTVFTPTLWLLAFFLYYDRGLVSASLDNLQTQLFDDNSFKSNALASAYLIGYCLTSPIFAFLGSYRRPVTMSGIGLIFWALGCALTGIFSNFYLLISARLLTGIGEASFLVFASTLIDAISPNETRALWLGVFYMGIPFGYAFGMGIGGIVNDISLSLFYINNQNQTWRILFLSESVIVLPVILLLLFYIRSPATMLHVKKVKNEFYNIKMSIDETHATLTDDSVLIKCKRILCNPVYLLSSFGYASQTFVTGTFSIEAITYMKKVYSWDSSKAGTVIGAITLFTGIIGGLLGGWILDKMKNKVDLTQMLSNFDVGKSTPAYLYIKPCLKWLVIISAIALPAGLIIAYFESTAIFVAGMFVCEFCIFASVGPVNNAVLWSVLYRDRPVASAFNTLFIHLFGDALAPLLIAALLNARKNAGYDDKGQYQFALQIAVWVLVLPIVFFLCGLLFLKWLKRFMQLHEI